MNRLQGSLLRTVMHYVPFSITDDTKLLLLKSLYLDTQDKTERDVLPTFWKNGEWKNSATCPLHTEAEQVTFFLYSLASLL